MTSHKAQSLHNLNNAKKRLLLYLLLFCIGLCIPLYYLLHTAYTQLANETWYTQRNQAQLLIDNIEQQLLNPLQIEQDRAIAEYNFFNLLENPLLQSTSVNISPLAQIPPKTDIPGLIGYFQINPDGSFQIPALPELDKETLTGLQIGLGANALQQRQSLKSKLKQLLSAHESEKHEPAAHSAVEKRQQVEKKEHPEQQLFNQSYDLERRPIKDVQPHSGAIGAQRQSSDNPQSSLSEAVQSKLDDDTLEKLKITTKRWKQKLNKQYKSSAYAEKYARKSRKETVKLPQQSSVSALFKSKPSMRSENADIHAEIADRVIDVNKKSLTKQPKKQPVKAQLPKAAQPEIDILSFETEVSPLQLLRLRQGHFCFYRHAWNDKQRYIQGFIVDASFLNKTIRAQFNSINASSFSSLYIFYRGQLLHRFQLQTANQESLLYRRSLQPPLQNLELVVNTGQLSSGFGKQLLDRIVIALSMIICAGLMLFYRLGAGHIELARLQRNFISAVSHELKTPLTSIRMYAEMLRAGWVEDESRKHSYYDFMFFESERLSRLINNVLQLARLDNKQELQHPVDITTTQLLQQTQQKVLTQIEAANFQLHLIPPKQSNQEMILTLDPDAFYQIMINLVDNAIKFSSAADNKSIEIGYRTRQQGKWIVFFVRDYGPGIEKNQNQKIFRLFYRSGDELTRTQPGTGIGLALVAQLAATMHAEINVVNCDPGAEFQLLFKDYNLKQP